MGLSWTRNADASEMLAQPGAKRIGKIIVIPAHQPLRNALFLCPNDRRPVTGEGKHRERPRGKKILMRLSAMRQFMRDRCDDPHLPVIYFQRFDSRGFSQSRALSIGRNDQPCRQPAPSAGFDLDATVHDRHLSYPLANQLHMRAESNLVGKDRLQYVALDEMARSMVAGRCFIYSQEHGMRSDTRRRIRHDDFAQGLRMSSDPAP